MFNMLLLCIWILRCILIFDVQVMVQRESEEYWEKFAKGFSKCFNSLSPRMAI